MNRKDRRNLARNIAKNSKSMKFKSAWQYVTESSKINEMEEGQAVLLNYSWIKMQDDFKYQPPEFWDWLEEHKDGVFHVKYDEKLKETKPTEYKKFVSLEEDDTDPKWIMRSDALIPVTIHLNNNEEEKKEEDTGATDEVNEVFEEEEK